MMQNDYTALHWAAQKGHADVVDVLVDHGAVVEAKTKVSIFWLILNNMQNIAVSFVYRS